MLEKLESRQLLTSMLQAGVLTVTGTNASETISVVVSGTKLTVKQTGNADAVFAKANVLHVVVNANGGSDKVDCSTVTVPVELHGGAGNDTLIGGSNGDNLFGDAGNDSLAGNGGKDALHGGADNDILDGGPGNDFLDGQAGSDTADYSHRTVPITAEIDITALTPTATTSPFTLLGFGGQAGEKDTYSGVETISGGSKNDTLFLLGPALFNKFVPHYGNFALIGNGGNDGLSTDGSDFVDDAHIHVSLMGGSGADSFGDNPAIIHAYEFGGPGNDTFGAFEQEDASLPGPRVVDAGSGIDTEEIGSLDVAAVTLGTGLENLKIDSHVTNGFTVTGNSLDNTIDCSDQTLNNAGVTINGAGGKDTIIGTPFADKINGGSGDDVIHGGKGNDTITGDTGHDMLFGDAGNDTLFSKDSLKDTVNGGIGSDKANRDLILDVVSNVETFI